MDDIILFGSSYNNLKKAAESVTRYAKSEFNLTIKPTWQIQKLDQTPVDMMGYLIYSNGKAAVRPRVFLRIRRMALRTRKKMNLSQAMRICSYKGYFYQKNFKPTNCKANRKYKLYKRFNSAQKLISERMKTNGNCMQRG